MQNTSPSDRVHRVPFTTGKVSRSLRQILARGAVLGVLGVSLLMPTAAHANDYGGQGPILPQNDLIQAQLNGQSTRDEGSLLEAFHGHLSTKSDPGHSEGPYMGVDRLGHWQPTNRAELNVGHNDWENSRSLPVWGPDGQLVIVQSVL